MDSDQSLPTRTSEGQRVSQIHANDVNDPTMAQPSKLIPRHDPISGTNAFNGFRLAMRSSNVIIRYAARLLLLIVLVSVLVVVVALV